MDGVTVQKVETFYKKLGFICMHDEKTFKYYYHCPVEIDNEYIKKIISLVSDMFDFRTPISNNIVERNVAFYRFMGFKDTTRLVEEGYNYIADIEYPTEMVKQFISVYPNFENPFQDEVPKYPPPQPVPPTDNYTDNYDKSDVTNNQSSVYPSLDFHPNKHIDYGYQNYQQYPPQPNIYQQQYVPQQQHVPIEPNAPSQPYIVEEIPKETPKKINSNQLIDLDDNMDVILMTENNNNNDIQTKVQINMLMDDIAKLKVEIIEIKKDLSQMSVFMNSMKNTFKTLA